MLKRFNSTTGDARIVIITTGGTIVQKFDNESGGYVPKTSGNELIESIAHQVTLENIKLIEYSMIDSRAIDSDFLHGLATLVQAQVNDDTVDGVIIVHGTDTMEITAYFLHRTIVTSRKSVVITGAMRVVTNSDYDGTANITNSIKQVSNPQSIEYGYGVCINFAGKIHSPIYVYKEHSFAIDPYASGNYGVIGMMHTSRIDWLNTPRKSSIIPLPKKLASVPIVYAYPGAQPDFLDGFVGKMKGIVVIGYGSGNVSVNMYTAIKNVIEKGLMVCLVTNCKYGGVYQEYGGIGGNKSLSELGVIMADDLNGYQAMVCASLLFDNEHVQQGDRTALEFAKYLEQFFSNKIV